MAVPSAASDPGPLTGRIAGWLILLLWAELIFSSLIHTKVVGLTTGIPVVLLLTYLALESVRFSRTVWVHLTFGFGMLGVTLFLSATPLATILTGLERAVMVAALFVAMGLLRVVASASPMVHACGTLLIRQPPGRRYAAMTVGGHIFGIILNFGVVNLLGPMIRPPGSPVADKTQRRLFLALLRGFCTVIFWSPLTLAFAIISAAWPSVDWGPILGIGFVSMIAGLTLGWAVDRWGERTQDPTATRTSNTEENAADPRWWAPPATIIGLVSLMILASFLTERLLDIRLIVAIMLIVPVIAIVWYARQAPSGERTVHCWSALKAYAESDLSGERRAIAVLANAAFVGSLIGLLIPAGSVSGLIAGLGIPALLIAPIIVLFIMVLAPFGVNPLMTISLLVGVLPSPETLGLAEPVLVLSLLMGWGLSIGATNATAAVLSTASQAGVSPDLVARHWNRTFSILGMLFVTSLLVALQLILGPAAG